MNYGINAIMAKSRAITLAIDQKSSIYESTNPEVFKRRGSGAVYVPPANERRPVAGKWHISPRSET